MEENGHPEEKRGITMPVFVVSIVSFLNDVASDMIYPIVPIFLTTVLGAPVTVVGLMEGIAESTSSFLRIASGAASDKLRKRKPFIVIGYMLSASSKFFYAFATSWHSVLVGRFSDRLGKGVRTAARDAYIAQNTAPRDRGKAFGFHRGMDTLGAVAGPLIGILLLQYFGEDYHKIFLFSLIPTAIAVALLIIFLKEKPWDIPEKNERTSIRGVLRNFPKPLIIFLVINMIFAIGNSSDAFIILRTQGLGFTMISTILVYALFNFTYASFSVPAGIVSDKMGPRNILVLGFIIFSVVYLLFGYATTPLFIWILFPLYGVYMALTDGVSKAYISNIVPGEVLGTAYGIYQFAIGFCAFFASLIAGLLWTKVGEQAPFIFGGVMALIAALLLILVGPKRKPITE